MQRRADLARRLSLAATVLVLTLLGTVVAGSLCCARGQTLPSPGQPLPQIPPPRVVINEVAWSGTAFSSADEWIELYNNTPGTVDLAGWTLTDGGDIQVLLSGALTAHAYLLLERSDDCSVGDIPAGQIYTGSLGDAGELLRLYDPSGTLVDTADGSAGWPAGSGSPDRLSMERIAAAQPDAAANWAGNNTYLHNGIDCGGAPLNGTPGARNSVSYADLSISKRGPAVAQPGEPITYTITLSNAGQLPAESARLTESLPAQVQFLSQTSPFSMHQPQPGTLVWELGTVPTTTAGAPLPITVTCRVDGGASGQLVNAVTVSSVTTESRPADNHDTLTTLVSASPLTATVLIEALYYDAYEAEDADEAFRLINLSDAEAPIGGWRVTDQEATAIFPPETALAPFQAAWCAREAAAFARQFGFKPAFEFGDDTDPTVPDMLGGTPRFADGDELIVQDSGGQMADSLVYEGGDTGIEGWAGAAVEPWTAGSTFAAFGQILYRKRDQAGGLPAPDTDTAADWAQHAGDPVAGRKVQYPGWDLDLFFHPQQITETATLTVAVAPDNLFEAVAPILASARESIQIETFTFASRELAEILLDRIAHGVAVTLLLEGAPPFEGVTDEERWIAGRLSAAGAQVLFMVNDPDAAIYDRYDNLHAKFAVVDGRTVLVGSENLNPTSFPADDKGNGTAGRRGVYLITDASGVVTRARDVFSHDADAAGHADLVDCTEAPDLCTPPSGFEPAYTPDWMSYTVRFPQPLSVTAELAFELVQSPENSLRDRDALLGLLRRAGPGDWVLVEQFYEQGHWGGAAGNPTTDVNPRLEAYLAASRRGASVRILLDDFLDIDGTNLDTAAYLQPVALAERLDLQIRRGNPTGLGLHNKMVLAQIGGEGYVHVGSINGSEVSSKGNREMALQVRSDAAYDYLKAVFDYDWSTATPPVYLPWIAQHYPLAEPADHLLVTEVLYNTAADGEWVELYNPTETALDLLGYKLGDAAEAGGSEAMYCFPPGTSLGSHQLLVVAVTAGGFREGFGFSPDLEMQETDPAVPNLSKYVGWGTGSWALGNDGDEVVLLDGADQAVDVLVFGSGYYPEVVPHPGGVDPGSSLERYPPWQDTDDCSLDFRGSLNPSPGALP